MILQSFFKYLTFEKRFSKHTLVAYRSDLQQFQDYCSFQYQLNDILLAEPAYIRSWMVELMRREMDVRTIRRKRSVLNSFFNFSLKQGSLKINPMTNIPVPKLKKRLPNYLRKKELEKLNQLLPSMQDFASARDHAIIKLFFSTGMRRAELIALRLSDLRLSERNLRVIGKRNKERIIPLSDEMVSALLTYMEFRNDIKYDGPALFLTNKLKLLYPKFAYNLVKRFLSQVTSADGRSPHVLRHTFATLMLDEGADINAIKSLLGHADLNATQVYTHTSIEKLKDTYQQAHPKARTN